MHLSQESANLSFLDNSVVEPEEMPTEKRWGCQLIIVANSPPPPQKKLHENQKNWTQRGCASLAPFDPPMSFVTQFLAFFVILSVTDLRGRER